MMAGDGDGKRTFGGGLAADMVENGAIYGCFDIFYNSCGVGRKKPLAFEMKKELLEVFDPKKCNAGNEGGLGEVLEREIDLGNPGGASGLDDVDDAMDWAKITVEGELADKETSGEVFLAELMREGEDG